jgi:hypothetical protein
MRWVSLFGAGLFCVGLGAGCGGQATEDGRGAGGMGSASGGRITGGSSAGGAASGGHNASSGGAGVGGSPGGSSSGGAGTGGAGASVGMVCQTPGWGACDVGMADKVYFDEATGSCRSAFGLCMVSDVASAPVFDTLAECLSVCQGARPAEDACDTDVDCVLSAGCCSPCQPWSLEDLSATNVAVEPGPCPDIACGACPEPTEMEQNTDYFWAICQYHQCRVVDLTQGDQAACSQTSECFLREGSGCCEGCDGTGYVPLSATDYLGGRCDNVACPKCATPFPTGVTASCDPDTQRCVKVELSP